MFSRWCFALATCVCWGQAVAPDVHRALESVQANTLKGHVSFLASDLLEGRDSPSRGLDVAAEYIAAEFRKAGLEPLGDDGYFQTMRWQMVSHGAAMHLHADSTPISSDAIRTNFLPVKAEGELIGSDAPDVAGKIVRFELNSLTAFSNTLAAWQQTPPLAVIVLDEKDVFARFYKTELLVDPERNRESKVPVIVVHGAEAIKTLRQAKTARVEIAVLAESKALVRNVAGVVRGSHPELSQTAIVVSAHYDHIGLTAQETGDRVFNGANDNASGTAVLLDLARAFASMSVKPTRSIVFLAVAAEEKGVWGSEYYVRHPLWPLKDTVANINFEMFGRTADSEFSRANQTTMTGAGYSSVTDAVRTAAEASGSRFFIHPQGNDEFFERSDNLPFAKAGIPAHTVTPGFVFDDYHQPGDEWQKLDYSNMERAARTAGLSVYFIANDPVAPVWNSENEKARKFADAR